MLKTVKKSNQGKQQILGNKGSAGNKIYTENKGNGCKRDRLGNALRDRSVK